MRSLRFKEIGQFAQGYTWENGGGQALPDPDPTPLPVKPRELNNRKRGSEVQWKGLSSCIQAGYVAGYVAVIELAGGLAGRRRSLRAQGWGVCAIRKHLVGRRFLSDKDLQWETLEVWTVWSGAACSSPLHLSLPA